MLSGCYTLAIAQQPVLQQKKDLPDQLVKEFNINGNDVNIIKIADYAPHAGKDYTIEVSLKVNNASERGRDIETTDKNGKGLRASKN